MSEPKVLLNGLGFPESTRWHEGRAWLCNWGTGEVLAVNGDGEREVAASLARETIPLSIDWQLPDGRMLIVDGPGGRLLRQEPGGNLHPVADLTALGRPPFNELVVAPDGNAYVNGGPGIICVKPDGGMRVVADGLQWPNGMAITDDGRTLIVADSHLKQLLAFEVASDGTLAGRRIWADLEDAPDGICADADGAVWVRDRGSGQRCVRVRGRRRRCSAPSPVDREMFCLHAGR